MGFIIIYPSDVGGVKFCYPTEECGLPVSEIARKDVPAGKPYRIVPSDSVPEDFLFYDAYEADFSNPDGYGIGSDAWFAEQAAANEPLEEPGAQP